MGSVEYQRQCGKFAVIFSVKTYIPQCSHIVYSCKYYEAGGEKFS